VQCERVLIVCLWQSVGEVRGVAFGCVVHICMTRSPLVIFKCVCMYICIYVGQRGVVDIYA
jgi:hypothetical protein